MGVFMELTSPTFNHTPNDAATLRTYKNILRSIWIMLKRRKAVITPASALGGHAPTPLRATHQRNGRATVRAPQRAETAQMSSEAVGGGRLDRGFWIGDGRLPLRLRGGSFARKTCRALRRDLGNQNLKK